MNAGIRTVIGAVFAVAAGSAVSLAVSPTWGWLAVLAIASLGSIWLAASVGRSYVQPMERLADVVRPHVALPDAPAAELARLVAFEYRDAVQRVADAVSESGRREAALTHARDGVVLIGPDGLVEYANPAAREFVNDRVLDIAHRLIQPDLQRLVRQSHEIRAPMREEVVLRVPGPRPALATAVPLVEGSCVLLLADLTESYRIDQVRRDFVANVSHELKTPVAAVRALSDVAASALSDGDHATTARFIDRLQTETDRLAKLVADLLDLSRVESGEALRLEEVDVRGLLDSACDAARPLAEPKGVELFVDGPAATVVADPAQVRMAVQNLVDNAVRYSDSGTVRLSVHPAAEGTSVAVSDEGIGIPADELPRIFERFYRVDRARSRATGGTGLGLAIARHVAENHGGRVEVSSELGRGSTFTLWLPRQPGESGNAA